MRKAKRCCSAGADVSTVSPGRPLPTSASRPPRTSPVLGWAGICWRWRRPRVSAYHCRRKPCRCCPTLWSMPAWASSRRAAISTAPTALLPWTWLLQWMRQWKASYSMPRPRAVSCWPCRVKSWPRCVTGWRPGARWPWRSAKCWRRVPTASGCCCASGGGEIRGEDSPFLISQALSFLHASHPLRMYCSGRKVSRKRGLPAVRQAARSGPSGTVAVSLFSCCPVLRGGLAEACGKVVSVV